MSKPAQIAALAAEIVMLAEARAWDLYSIIPVPADKRTSGYMGQWLVSSETKSGTFYKVSLRDNQEVWECGCWAYRRSKKTGDNTCKHCSSVQASSLVFVEDIHASSPGASTRGWSPAEIQRNVFKDGQVEDIAVTGRIQTAVNVLAGMLDSPGLSVSQKAALSFAHRCARVALDPTMDFSELVQEGTIVDFGNLERDLLSVASVGHFIEWVEKLGSGLSLSPGQQNALNNAVFWLEQIRELAIS